MPDLKMLLTRYVEEQTPTVPPPLLVVDVPATKTTRRRIATIAAVPVVLVATVVGVQLAKGPARSTPPGGVPIAAGPSQVPSQGPSQAPVVAGGSSASCVEQYSLDTLKHAAFAFDGTVTKSVPMRPPADGSGVLDGYRTVTFVVHEWFRGDGQATVTVDMMASPDSGTVSSVEGASFGIGTRLLVSGAPRFGGAPLKAPIAWSCGFTRGYDPTTAAAWR